MNNITLNSSMRSNLLSLQNVSRLQDVTSNRLSTGLKVNSAIDNPSSFYAAQSLTNRASDLNALLDSMSQGVQSLKAASQSLEAGANFLQQAKAVANQAMEKIGMGGSVGPTPPTPPSYTGPIAATVTSTQELLDAIKNTTAADGVIVIANDLTFANDIKLELKEGQRLVGQDFINGTTGNKPKLSFTFTDASPNDTSAVSGNNIYLSDLAIDLNKLGTSNGVSALGKTGQTAEFHDMDITTSGQYSNGISDGTNTLSGTVNITTSGYDARGISDGTNTLSGTINITTSGEWSNGIYQGTNTLSGTVNITTSGNNAFGILEGTNTFKSGSQVLIQTKNSVMFYSVNATWEVGAKVGYKNSGLSDAGHLWTADTAGAQSSIRTSDLSTISGWKRSGDFPQAAFEEAFAPKVMRMALAAAPAAAPVADVPENPQTNPQADVYNSILQQFNLLLKDSGYKGVNLLLEQGLKINFNEDRSSTVDVKGVDASAKGLGLTDATWKTQADIEKSISELDSAIGKIRSYSSEFGNYYNIVSTRENFTKALVNVLEEGSDKLSLADMNQESANMLALQTRQQLAINSLSLASQAAQSVLKLF